MPNNDARVKVIMRSTSIGLDGAPVVFQATDWVFPDDLTRYTDDARTRWQYVTVDEYATTPPEVLAGDYTTPTNE